MLRKITAFFATCLFLFLLASPVVFAQDPAKCSGDPQICAQIIELQANLQVQKELAAKQASDNAADAQARAEAEAVKTAKMMGLAAIIAVGLKIAISMAKAWTGYFKTDKGKASIRVGTLILGFIAFILTNIGAGVTWWQALIVAGGPPGAILVHELMDLFPVIQGKKTLAELPPEDQEPLPPAPEGN